MPDRPWRRRRRQPEEGGPQKQDAQVTRSSPPAGGETRYLHRAVSCYVRAGQPAQAARYLTRLAAHEQAALLYLRSGDYQLAVRAYADAGQPEAAAWVQVHHLNDPETAREILQGALPEPGSVADTDRLLSWQDRVGRARERLGGQAPATAIAGGTSSPESVRPRIDTLTTEILGDSKSDSDLTPFLAEIRHLKRMAISQQDWSVGYAAREMERLLIDEQAAREEERKHTEQRRRENLLHDLSRRQVYARCDAADGVAHQRIVPVLTKTQAVLADPSARCPERLETWAVAIAEAIRRYDQVALIFAASCRGQRPGAALRWREWSADVFHADLTSLATAEAR